LFIGLGLLGPLIRTIYLSFHNRNATKSVGWDNYKTIFTSKNSVNFENWQNIFTSRLFYIALALVALGILVGVLAGRRRASPSSGPVDRSGPRQLFVLSCAILSSIRARSSTTLVGHRRRRWRLSWVSPSPCSPTGLVPRTRPRR
jgi:hypothetical protein